LSLTPCRRASHLLKEVGDLVDAGLRTDIVLSGRTGDTDGADDFIACLDRQPAAACQHARILPPADRLRSLAQPLDEVGGGLAERSCSIGLALGAFGRVQTRS